MIKREVGTYHTKRTRIVVFVSVTVLHIALIAFVRFGAEVPPLHLEAATGVLRLVNVQEALPPPRESFPLRSTQQEVRNNSAPVETLIESMESTAETIASVTENTSLEGEIEYFSEQQVSALPLLPENEIASRIVYPLGARQLGIEGLVLLELLIDSRGLIRNARIVKEEPTNRGFGAAALSAFQRVQALRPAHISGRSVAVRFHYTVHFRLR